MPLGPIAAKIAFHQKRARMLARKAARHHFRAAQVGKLALASNKKGWPKIAARQLRRAFRLKAAGARFAVRATLHHAAIARLRHARQLRARHLAG